MGKKNYTGLVVCQCSSDILLKIAQSLLPEEHTVKTEFYSAVSLSGLALKRQSAESGIVP